MFVEKYLKSLNTSDLRDDELHHQTDALAAAALADLSGGSGDLFGSLLARTKYADGTHHKTFEAGNHNLAVLLRAWTKLVTQKGLDRQWLKIKHEWDIKAAYGIYEKIARVSLAHWLQGECEVCNGTKIAAGRACTCCAGTGRQPIAGGALEVERVKDMISELEGLYQAHGARAAVKLRRAA
jgi:hypothetical protein